MPWVSPHIFTPTTLTDRSDTCAEMRKAHTSYEVSRTLRPAR